MITELSSLLEQAGLSLSDRQIAQLAGYVTLLYKWNKAYNLTSVRDPQQMLIRHILDSIVVEPHLQGNHFIDVGTGPGLPGIPLAIVRPGAHFTLLDSLGKRIRFLKQVQHELQIGNITLVQSRVEGFHANPLFDGVISRAFASLNDMLNWCHHLPAQRGVFYALKGMLPEDEISALPAGFILNRVIKLSVPRLEEERHLVAINPPA
ncbi:16S rRNA (guanine(527)-N(7))-methyltransferase RsmG [Erwinia tracheiphila]|uniref:Ribosomal RNA small subunit methyltransferase G n=1 Tax=Erwinia tracheiphila TaxID=65700 RepID=A0A0M2KCD4_9GAMM|nr:16S rRNA (guanine(527)-N(7))-methyltransferase RsmG [Erwinia tracheiphila]EOS93509.1 16S rRNA methyltransferase GidB [Erwinia tracheiphila PSU-1]KKF36609.1 16S rRNA methyltransferase [Erwinia tracheiphila]UIA87943.1 16S rRNA (guanine(527)-N(7))-methyltransferase RsmG [Erwinia tracheiphila]UIA96531.1 16S rRNA (guanine(527)-N(7))-methyltransferase RsmG [Erwinia tracheiphila]